MATARRNPLPGGVLVIGAVTAGLLLVAYGLIVAPWVRSSDSSTGFRDLSFGDPPYGFSEAPWAEIVARPYFNGGAWIVLGGVAALAGAAVVTRRADASAGARWVGVAAAVWSFAAVLALQLVDLRVGAYLPTIGHAIAAGALVTLSASHRWSRVLLAVAAVTAAAAVVVWFVPVNAFDSACSLARRHQFDNQDACRDTISMLTRWFVGLVLATVVFGGVAAVLAIERHDPVDDHHPPV